MEAEVRQLNDSNAYMRSQGGAGTSGQPVYSYVPPGSRSDTLVGAAGGIGARRRKPPPRLQLLPELPGDVAGGSTSFAEHGGHSEEMLSFAARHCAEWDKTTDAMIRDLCACGWCGRPAFGGQHSEHKAHMRTQQSTTVPPGLLAHPGLMSLAKAGPDLYWSCKACHGKDGAKRRDKQQSHLQVPVVGPGSALGDTPFELYRQLLGMLLALPVGAGLQLSVLRCAVRFAQRVQGYVHALENTAEANLLDGPLVNWACDVVGTGDVFPGSLPVYVPTHVCVCSVMFAPMFHLLPSASLAKAHHLQHLTTHTAHLPACRMTSMPVSWRPSSTSLWTTSAPPTHSCSNSRPCTR
jgi:hypothetical protein